VEAFAAQADGARLLLKKVGEPEQFGVAALDEEQKMIMEIQEKPKHPKSEYAVIGVYMYGPEVFGSSGVYLHRNGGTGDHFGE